MDAVDQILNSIKEQKFVDKETIEDSKDGISLLSLKNESLLSYIINILLVAESQQTQNEQIFNEARTRSIEQRVTIEKGVKNLETKISYQIDKVLRAYKRSTETANSNEQDSDSDLDPTSFKPNAPTMDQQSESENEADDTNKRYVAPKIQATLPEFEKPKEKPSHRRRDFAMEEYLREQQDAPVAEPSIGSTIMDSGRGGERTRRELEKDREVQSYEENNFTRISNTSSKRARKEAAQRQSDATTNSFFGEDWRFLDSINGDQQRSKKRKTRK